jgi:creatinine amidohydrolase/Fe(II)-dependent formamide hydrolase-like protein
MLAVEPDLVGVPPARDEFAVTPPTALSLPPAISIHSPQVWRAFDGWTDQPAKASAEFGETIIAAVAAALGQALVQWRT